MGLIAKNSGADFERTPAGNHVARCYMVCDMGMQESVFNGETSLKHKVRVSFELPNELMEDGRPFSTSKNYTLSLHEKAALRKDLVSWRGRQFTDEELDGFDLFNIVGVPCMLNVVHNQNGDKVFTNIEGITPLPKGMECPPGVNPQTRFSLEDPDWEEKFNSLPEWLQQKINTHVPQTIEQEYDNLAEMDNLSDEIPF